MKARFKPITGKTGAIVDAVMASEDIPEGEDLRMKIRLCVEEIVSNVINYAYPDGAGDLEVSTRFENSCLYVSFKDSGVAFNPLEKEDPDVSLTLEEKSIGGLGIFLCKKMSDGMEYERKDGCNVLTLKIKCAAESSC